MYWQIAFQISVKRFFKILIVTQTFVFYHKRFHSAMLSFMFVYSRKHSHYLYLIPHVSHFLWSFPYLHLILLIPSARLLTKFDNGLAINLPLSIRFILQDMVCYTFTLPFLSIFLISLSSSPILLKTWFQLLLK